MSTYSIHDIQFFNPEPRAIHCIAVQPSKNKLALSRSDNSIEIWDIRYTPHVDRIFIGGKNNSVESLAWCKDRIFSAGLGGTITEHDLLNLDAKYSTPVTSGPCWCIAVSKDGSTLAAGTEDGYINLLEIFEDNISHQKLLDKQEVRDCAVALFKITDTRNYLKAGRILCITWNSNGDFLVTGSADAVRIWNVHTGHAIHKLTPGRTISQEETIVWSVAVTDDFIVISGDSRGKLTFWDGNMGLYIDSHQSHKADILSVCLNADQTKIYCAGVDPLIASFERINVRGVGNTGQQNYKWVKSIQRNIHDHDVRALSMCEEKLFSGGVDGYLAMSSYPPKILIKYSPILQTNKVLFSPQQKYLMLSYDYWLEIWHLFVNKSTVKLVELKSYKNKPIRCSAISPDGNWIIYSTDFAIRLFHFSLSETGDPILKRNDLPSEYKPSVCVVFSSDSKYICIATKRRQIVIGHLSINDGVQSLTVYNQSNEVLKDVIHLLAVHDDGEYVVAADRSSNIAVWNTKTDKQFKLPKYNAVPTAIHLDNVSNDLVVCYSDHKIVEFNLDIGTFTQFSKTLGSKHPKQLLNRQFPVQGILIHPENKNVILFYDDTTICIIDKTKKLPETNCKLPRLDPVRTTPDSDNSESGNSQFSIKGSSEFAFHVLKVYKHLLFLDFLNQNDLIAVEVNPETLIEKLPPMLRRKRFGIM